MPEDKESNVTDIEKARKKKSAVGWEGTLIANRGKLVPSLANTITVLYHHEAWDGVFELDEQADRVRKAKPIPWHPVGAPAKNIRAGVWLTDPDVVGVRNWIERFYEFAPSKETTREAIWAVASQKAYHPVRSYLNGLVWDGVARLNDWLGYLKVELNPYSRAVGAKWLISAVARAMVPGCQADYMLVVEGKQRIGKSTALSALVPNPAWFLATKIDLGNKDAYQIIASKWIVCFDELDSMSRADDTRSKAFITNRVDSYCKRYSKEPTDQPRGCVLAGSTNEDVYLKDATGGGRYWPVWSHGTPTSLLDTPGIIANRDQLWAEAMHRYKEGEPWHLTDPAIIAMAEVEQAKRLQHDPWEETIAQLLRSKRGANASVTTGEVLAALEISPGRATKADEMRAARTIKANGWVSTGRTLKNGVTMRMYVPKK